MQKGSLVSSYHRCNFVHGAVICNMVDDAIKFKRKQKFYDKFCIAIAFFTSHMFLQDLMVGDEASQLRSMLEVNYPMENGIVRNWEDMTHLYDYTFGETKMNLDTKNTRVLLTEPPLNPSRNRDKMVEVCFIGYMEGHKCT